MNEIPLLNLALEGFILTRYSEAYGLPEYLKKEGLRNRVFYYQILLKIIRKIKSSHKHVGEE